MIRKNVCRGPAAVLAVAAVVAILSVAGCGSSGPGAKAQASPTVQSPAWQLIYTDVDFLSPSLGLISGWKATILRSTDEGQTWTAAKVNSRSDLNSVAILNASTAVAVGSAGNILRSTDAGRTWSPVSSPTTQTLNKVVRVDDNTAVAVGWGGTILRTSNGGTSWTSQFQGNDPSLNIESVDFRGGAGMADSSNGHAYRSVDGGISWQPVTMPENDLQLYSVSMFDPVHALMVGNVTQEEAYVVGGKAVLMFTGDGGGSWSFGARDINTDFLVGRMLDPQTAVAGGWSGDLWRTSDAGRDWQKEISNTSQAIRAFGAPDATTLVAVGDGQTILISRNSGFTWQKIKGQ